MKVNNKMLYEFLDIMEDYNEFVYGTEEEIKKQLELCLNTQGYWSGCSIRVYYDNNNFRIERRF